MNCGNLFAKRCGHKVVVHPELPANYTPKVCTPCYEKFQKPEDVAAMAEILLAADNRVPDDAKLISWRSP